MRLAILPLIAAATFMTGCDRHGHEHEIDHEHEHGLAMTAYSDSLELYAEVHPLILGTETPMTVYLTRLDTFRPLEVSSASACVTSGGKTAESEGTVVSAGTVSFMLNPEAAGAAEITVHVTDSYGSDHIISAGSTQVLTDHEEAEAMAEAAAPQSPNTVTFTKEQSWLTDFATEECRLGQTYQVIRAAARVAPSQRSTATLTAPAGGIVEITGGDIVEGSPVRAGQTIMTVRGSGTGGRNTALLHTQAESRYRAAAAQLARKEALAADSIVSQSELELVRKEFEQAEAEWRVLSENADGGKADVRSPIGGYVTSLTAANGDWVDEGQRLGTVSGDRDVFLHADIRPVFYPLLENIRSANITIPSTGKVLSLEELGGCMVSYGRSTDGAGATVPVTFAVRAADGLLPGSFVEMLISAGDSHESISVPNGALTEEMGDMTVFVQITPELFEKRVVTTGADDGMRTEILSGLKEGERVVTVGALRVKLAQGAGTLDPHAGHIH